MVTNRRIPGRQQKSGFTLVEILVVIAIITVLAALLTPVAMRALTSARDARMGIELAQLSQAIEAYRTEMGDYPPSFGENYSSATRFYTAVEQHFRKCYPNVSVASKNKFYNYLEAMAGAGKEISQDEALVMWLSMSSADKTAPFQFMLPAHTGYPAPPFPDSSIQRKVYREFDVKRLSDVDSDGFFGFDAGYARGTPYVYLDSRTYYVHVSSSGAATTQIGAGGPRIQPYFDASGKYINFNSFQIICAGQDGDFGAANNIVLTNVAGFPMGGGQKVFPRGDNYKDEDQDNITNFSEGKRLKFSIPQ